MIDFNMKMDCDCENVAEITVLFAKMQKNTVGCLN